MGSGIKKTAGPHLGWVRWTLPHASPSRSPQTLGGKPAHPVLSISITRETTHLPGINRQQGRP